MKSSLPPLFYLRAQKKHGGRYIARRKARVIASAKTLKDLMKVMKARRIPHAGEVSIGYVPSSHSLHVYLNR